MASDFSIEIQRWDLVTDGFSSTDNVPEEQYILLEYPLPDMDGERHVHAIPLSGISYRMEILGIQDAQRIFDFMVKEMNVPQEDETRNLYLEPVKNYHWAATEFAKELTQEAEESNIQLRSARPRETPEEFLATVRGLLKGGPQLRTISASINSVERVSSQLSRVRSTAVSSISETVSEVPMEDTGAAQDVRGFISESQSRISEMMDFHAHRVMQTGAYYYANLRRQQ